MYGEQRNFSNNWRRTRQLSASAAIAHMGDTAATNSFEAVPTAEGSDTAEAAQEVVASDEGLQLGNL